MYASRVFYLVLLLVVLLSPFGCFDSDEPVDGGTGTGSETGDDE